MKPAGPALIAVGDDGLLVEFEAEINLQVNRQVRRMAFAIEQSRIPGVVEVVPTYRSLMVYFHPDRTDPASLGDQVLRLSAGIDSVELPAPRVYRVPVVYGSGHGPDLEHVAAAAGMDPDSVVAEFSAQRYPVYCLGFLCCLAYLGGVPERLRLPRLATPRTHLPAGSVGIAGEQAVMLPIDQPSGFHYLGRTFVTLYDPRHSPPTPIRPGDLVECPAVSEDEARQWQGRSLEECLVGSATDS